jgi:hypothetical protein
VGNTAMNDRDVEAQTGDNYETQLESELVERPNEAKRLVMPKKADVSRSDQARRVTSSQTSATPRGKAVSKPSGPIAPLVRSTGTARKPVAQPRQVAERAPVKPARLDSEPAAAPIRLSSPHPLSRLRQERGGDLGRPLGQGRLSGLGRALGLGGLGKALGLGDGGGSRMSARSGAYRRGGPRLGIPSLRSIFGFAGLTATFGVVTALLVTLPSQPTTSNPTGSIYGIDWQQAAKSPVAKFDFGPYVTTLDNEVLMLGTVNSSNNGVVSSTTTVWVTTDGSNWSQRSGSGAFGIDGRRFVAQGLSDDGQGGLVAVGNSVGSSPTDVVASAWHSRDGASWTPMEVESGRGQEMIAGVAARPGAVVAAGNGIAWLSTDGHTWSPQVLPGAAAQGGSYSPRAVGSWNGGFAIVALWNGDGPTRSTAWYSPNGHDWTQAQTSLDGFDVRGMVGLNGKIVAVGADLGESAPGLGVAWSSDDGNTWTKTTAPTDLSNVAMDGVARAGNSLLAFGAPVPSTTPPAAPAGSGQAGSTPQAAAAELAWVTEDGVNWFPITSKAAPLARAHPVVIGSKVVLIGGSADALGVVSGDLVLGPARAPVGQSAPPANYALGLQAGNSPMIVDVNKDYALGPVANSSLRFYVFVTGPAGTAIYSSGDGGLWAQELKPAGLTSSVVAIAPVASSSASQPAASSSASQPAATAAPSGAAAGVAITGRPVVLQAIPDGHGGILAVGKVTNTSGDNGMIWHMVKPGQWKQVQFQDDAPPEFSSIVAGPSGYIASSDQAGGAAIMYSADGDSWQAGSIAVGDGFALTVATYRYGYVAVGTDPARQGATTAWTSPDGRTWAIRTDWHLPPNVSALFGMGNTLVAAAKTAPAATPSSSALAGPTPTPVSAAAATTTWWSSSTGVTWQKSGLETQAHNWAIVQDQILVLDPPSRAGNWTAWTSPNGISWQHPTYGAFGFTGSKTCSIGSNGSQVVVVSWESLGVLKDYYGPFTSQ